MQLAGLLSDTPHDRLLEDRTRRRRGSHSRKPRGKKIQGGRRERGSDVRGTTRAQISRSVSLGDIVEAVAILKDNAQAAKRILGPAHPAIESFKVHITLARMIRYTIDLHNRYGEEPNFSSQA